MARMVLGVPAQIARRSNRVLRPRDLAGVYAHPRAEVARLVANGSLRRLASGYYAVVPQDRVGDARWRPAIEAAALGIACADYEVGAVALMGVSAARRLDAIPRALAYAVVAVPRQRPTLTTEFGEIHFVKRAVERLDVERAETEMITGWATTAEQTMIDLVARPDLVPLAESDLTATLAALARRAERDRVHTLAIAQRRGRSWPRLATFLGEAADARR